MTRTSKYRNPIVGILIPTYNRVNFLKYAIESALNQTEKLFYIVVIDDSSTDHTKDYIASIHDDRVTYVTNEQNIGLARSINKGIDLFPSNVEWCTILCDDDRFGLDFIETMMNTIENCDAKSIIHSRRIFIHPDGKKIREALNSPDEESGLEYIKNRSRNLRETYLTGILFSRRIFKEIGGYPRFATGVGADDALIFALSIKDRLVYQRNTQVFITIHPGAESQEYKNFPLVYQSVNELRNYCIQCYYWENLSNTIPRKDLNKLISKYRNRILSNIWLGKLWSENLPEPELKELLETVSNKPGEFPLRIRIDALLLEKLGVYAERNFFYRGFWLLAEFLQKKMP
jgi:glycosyltransferase involved in cell wall biosynthesis